MKSVKTIAHLAGNTGPKMAFAFDTESTPGTILVHMVQFSSIAMPEEQFDQASFTVIHRDNDIRLDQLGNCFDPHRSHNLKTDPDVFDDMQAGRKTFEIRQDDRGFEVGDTLILRRTQYTGDEMAQGGKPLIYTGEILKVEVIHILRGPRFGLADDWVIMSTRPLLTEGKQ